MKPKLYSSQAACLMIIAGVTLSVSSAPAQSRSAQRGLTIIPEKYSATPNHPGRAAANPNDPRPTIDETLRNTGQKIGGFFKRLVKRPPAEPQSAPSPQYRVMPPAAAYRPPEPSAASFRQPQGQRLTNPSGMPVDTGMVVRKTTAHPESFPRPRESSWASPTVIAPATKPSAPRNPQGSAAKPVVQSPPEPETLYPTSPTASIQPTPQPEQRSPAVRNLKSESVPAKTDESIAATNSVTRTAPAVAPREVVDTDKAAAQLSNRVTDEAVELPRKRAPQQPQQITAFTSDEWWNRADAPAAQEKTAPQEPSRQPVATETSVSLKPTDSALSSPAEPESEPESEPEPEPEPEPDYPLARSTSIPGQVISPYPPEQILDVSGMQSGDLCVDPRNNKLFLLP